MVRLAVCVATRSRDVWPVRYDTTLKDLLWLGAPALLRQVAGAAAVSLDATEYPSTRARRPDFVARLETGGLFHLELQGAADADMAWRMLEYYGLISRQNGGTPLQQCILTLTDAAAARMPRGISHSSLEFRYDVRSFEALEPEPLLTSERADEAVLAILCRTTDIRTRVRVILERLGDLDGKARGDAITRLMILADLHDATEVVKTEVKAMPITINLWDNPVIREFVLEEVAAAKAAAAAEAAEKAAVEARAQGMAQGMAQGEAKILLRLLEHRFPGQVTETHRALVMSATSDRIEMWTDRLFDCGSVESLLAN